MQIKSLSLVISLLIYLISWTLPYAALPAVPVAMNIIYDDSLASGWQDWSWAQVNLAATSPVNGGSRSIAVSFDAWEGLYLHKAEVDTLGMTHLRFFIHGGSAGGQKINLYFNLQVGGSDQNGPLVAIPLPPANAWMEVQIPLSSLNPGHETVTGITWQDALGVSQPTFYIDDIALISPESVDAPQLSESELRPRSLPADGETTLIVRVRVSDPQGASDIAVVQLDATSLGRGMVALLDDGHSNDGAPNDGLYGAALTVPPGISSGERRLILTASDQFGHQSTLSLGAINVLAAPDGAIPPGLPARLGWGSNAWSETPGEDWQVNSGVPWDYVYQYITYGWESWGGSFVSRFVHQAWDKNYIPMVVVYMMLGVPPNCGESGGCYAQKLQDPTTVQNYLASLERAAGEAKGTKTVIFNLEPDFYGSMQQLSNSSSRPAGVQPNDPSSYPVALNKSGYPNNLAGFGRYLVDLIHHTAPNALVAPMASTWAMNSDPQGVTAAEAVQMAQSTAAFIDAMGGVQADLLVVEWSDRDAGSGLRPWWDDTDMETPRPTRAILWENALANTSHMRLLLWQMPVGNMSLNNTCNHYQDNRAAYAFSHTRDLVDAGVIGVLFGGGADCMTQVYSDGGFVAAQGAIAYAIPSPPDGLSALLSNGNFVHLRWNENSEPDLWRYRIDYRLTSNTTTYTMDVGRRNSSDILLPLAGEWEIYVFAIDAMGNESNASTAMLVKTSLNTNQLYLPIVRR